MSRLFIKCNECGTTHFISFMKRNHYVCSRCSYHTRLDASTRIKMLCDKRSFAELDSEMRSADPLNFPKYKQKLSQSMEATRQQEAIITGTAKINGYPHTIGVMEPGFIMASMGSVVGEKVTRMLEYSCSHKLPAIIIVTSGGARMQEGILSLMQMAKTSAAVKRLNDHGLPLFTILSDPTTGGVTASFALLGDVIIAEPNALIGFAGPRVIQQTIGQNLPPGFQRAEFLMEHGMIDIIVERKKLRLVLATLLEIHSVKPYKQDR